MTPLWNDIPRTAPPLLDVSGLAERRGVTERFVRRLVAERRIPFLKIGKFIRFDPRDIESWLDWRERSEL